MASGFFLGGAAEGMLESRKQGLAERTQDQDVGLRTRALDINEKQFAAEQGRKDITRLDEHFAQTMTQIGEHIKMLTEVGKSPQEISGLITPLMQSAQMLAQQAGRDPNTVQAMVQAQLASPSAVDKAAVAGAATATQAVSQDETERRLLIEAQKRKDALGGAAGGGVEPELTRRYKTTNEKTQAENALRDDYTKQAQTFVTVRDYFNNMKTAEQSGAGDIARVFAFMKMQDPGSAVLPGEAANAQNAAGVPEAVRSMYNKLIGGGILTAEARRQLESQAEKIYGSRALQHDKLTTQFGNVARRQGLNPNNVIIDLLPVAPQQQQPSANQAVQSRFPNLPPPPPGFVVQQ